MENITKKIISEKDKVTTIVQKEPAEGESTSSKIVQTADKIIITISSSQEMINKVLQIEKEKNKNVEPIKGIDSTKITISGTIDSHSLKELICNQDNHIHQQECQMQLQQS